MNCLIPSTVPPSLLKRPPFLRPALTLAAASLLCLPDTSPASLWSVPITFQESPGALDGFPVGKVEWATQAQPGPAAQVFDVLKATGTEPTSGQAVFASGQDGVPDISITTRVIDYSGGRWDHLYGGKTSGGLEAGARVALDSSISGDAAVVCMELHFDPSLNLTAGDFAMRLVSSNGTSELYEWTMITLGTAAEAPFNINRINDYTALDYNNLSSGAYYSPTGTPTGNAGTGNRLGTGRSITQFLSGAPGSPVSGGLVQTGWYGIDDFNAVVVDGPEDFLHNPFPGDGAIDDNQTITGHSLGLAPESALSSITIWFGYHDVGFDSDGDGFTATDTNIYERIAGMTLGSQNPVAVPEASPAVLGFLTGAALLKRRKRERIV